MNAGAYQRRLTMLQFAHITNIQMQSEESDNYHSMHAYIIYMQYRKKYKNIYFLQWKISSEKC